MKKILFLIAFTVLLSATSMAQKNYSFGYRQSSTINSDTTISLTPVVTQTIYLLVADTNVTFVANPAKAVVGDELIIQAKANTRDRVLVFGTNLTSVNDTIPSGKTRMYRFVWTGSVYMITGLIQTD
jgi:hypothetical protein